MRTTFLSVFAPLPLLLTFGLLSSSCGTQTPHAFAQDAVAELGRSCPTDLAVIRVADGWLWTPCGCAEGDRGWISAAAAIDTPVPCTLRAGAQLLIDYSSARLPHQLIDTSGTWATAPYFPRSERNRRVPVTTLSLPAAATYSFADVQFSSSPS